MAFRTPRRRDGLLWYLISLVSVFVLGVLLNLRGAGGSFGQEAFVRSIVSGTLIWYLLYFASFRRVAYWAAVTVLGLLLTVKIYYVYALGVHMEPAVFEGMFDTSPEEVARLGSMKPLLIFFVGSLYLGVVIEFGWLQKQHRKRRFLIHGGKWGVLLAVLLGYAAVESRPGSDAVARQLGGAFPLDVIGALADAGQARYRLYRNEARKAPLLGRYSFVTNRREPVIMLFLRGESLRRRSFPLVADDIQPENRLPDFGEYVFLDNVFSYANHTQAAVPWMLSRSDGDRLLNEKSFISVLSGLGFDTTWIGCDQSNLVGFATPIVSYSTEADRALFVGKLKRWVDSQPEGFVFATAGRYFNDSLQTAYLLSRLAQQESGRYFYWMEMNGSHVPWRGFAEDYVYDRPVCDRVLDEVFQCSNREAVNAYRSTVLATQHALRLLLQALKERNAIVIFAADHGESTGERGLYGHGIMIPEGARRIRDQINPAFMVWMSDRFARRHGRELQAVRRNAHAYMTHEVIFHSVLDILDVESEAVDPRKSIFSESFVGRPAFVGYRYEVEGGNVVKEGYNRLVFETSGGNPSAKARVGLRLHFGRDHRTVTIEVARPENGTGHQAPVDIELLQVGERIHRKTLSQFGPGGGVSMTLDVGAADEVRFRVIPPDDPGVSRSGQKSRFVLRFSTNPNGSQERWNNSITR